MTKYHGAGAATTSLTILVLISSTTTITRANVDYTSLNDHRNNDDIHRDATTAVAANAGKPIHVSTAASDNTAEPDEHHRIVILVPQAVQPLSPYSQRAKKPKKKPKPQPPKKKPKVHHHPNVVPVVHSGKVIHSHHHHGSVDHGHSHVAKAKHVHKHYGKGHQKHSHYGVGRITHKHGPHAPVKPPTKPKHWSTAGVDDVFGYPSYPSYPLNPQYQYTQLQQQQRYLKQSPPAPSPSPSHVQHRQQILHHRAPNFFNDVATPFGSDGPSPASSSHFNGGGASSGSGAAAAAAARYRTANDRRDLFSGPPSSLPAVAGQLIQIRRIPSSPSEQLVDTFIDKNTRSSLTAAALAFGNPVDDENDNENENEYATAIADAGENDDNENEQDANEDENENENENENESESESVKEDEFAAVSGFDRAIGEAAALAAVPRATSLQFDNLERDDDDDDDDQGGRNQATLNYATFAQPPPPLPLPTKNKIVAFSDAFHYQY